MLDSLKALRHDEEALVTVEYALLLSTVVLAAIGAWQGLGDTLSNTVRRTAETIRNIQ